VLGTTAGCSYRRTDSSNGMFIPGPTTTVIAGARLAVPGDGSSAGSVDTVTGTARIAADRSVLRREAEATADAVTLLVHGETVQTTDTVTIDGQWRRVVSTRGAGWLLIRDLDTAPATDAGDSVATNDAAPPRSNVEPAAPEQAQAPPDSPPDTAPDSSLAPPDGPDAPGNPTL
jgi:hypothetical protein